MLKVEKIRLCLNGKNIQISSPKTHNPITHFFYLKTPDIHLNSVCLINSVEFSFKKNSNIFTLCETHKLTVFRKARTATRVV